MLFTLLKQTFQSLTQGVIKINIVNNGDIKADYIVAIHTCDVGIEGGAIPAQARTLEPIPGRQEQLVFHVYTTQNIESSHVCLVDLKAPSGRVYKKDEVVQFDTTVHLTQYAEDFQQENQGSGMTLDKLFGIGDCNCMALDIPCKLMQFLNCWLDLLIMVVIVFAIVAGVIGLVIFFIAGGGQFLPAFLCFTCKSFGCCMKCVGCFTRFFIKETLKSHKKRRKRGFKDGRKRRKHRHHKKKKKVKHHHHQKRRPLLKSKHETLSEEQLVDYCENGTVCYMNISSETDHGKEMLKVLKKAMPLKVGDNFCLVGTVRQKKSQYQFICHEDLLLQTWHYRGSKWYQCSNHQETKRIPDKYRGYSLQLDHVLSTVSKKPWGNTTCINQPLEL